MNIVYSASDLYASLAGISLTSLLINHTHVPEIRIFILDNEIGEENKEKLRKTAETFHREICFVPLKESLRAVSLDMKRWNISTFGRLFEASSLPEVDKVLHLDCDTIVDGSLEDLWQTDLENHVLAAAPDCVSDGYKTNIAMAPEALYIQAGVLLLNLKRIRQLRLENAFAHYLETYGDSLAFADQEIINACVPASEKRELPLRYNSYTILHLLSYAQVKRFKHVGHMVSEENYRDARSHGVIYHYTWCALEGTRPWQAGDNHPQKARFLGYQAQSEWADMSLWPDRRSPGKKAITGCVNYAPKWLLTPAVGYFHGVYLPWKLARKRRKQTESRREYPWKPLESSMKT